MLASYQKPITVHSFIDEVVDCFLQFALYYQNDDNGIPLSATTSLKDLPETLFASVYAEIVEFCTTVREQTQQDFEPAQLGVDFYFARNDSVTGFWDKPEIYGKYTDFLQSLAEKYAPFKIDI